MLQYRTRNKNQLQVTIATLAFLLLTTLTGQQCLAQATQPEDANTGKPTQQVTPGVSSRTASPAETSKAITADPKTSPSHLKMFVKPLTLSELEVEAKAWQDLLKQNVERINALHIEIERVDAEISDFQDSGANAPNRKETTPSSNDSGAINPTSTENPAESPNESATTNTNRPNTLPNPNSDQVTTNGTPRPQTLGSLKARRDALSEQLTNLTLQKTEISQRFEIVLNSMELKGGDPALFRKYNSALTGVALEVTGATGMWRMFTSWILADQGGKRWAWNILRFIVILVVSYFGASILANFVRRAASRVRGVSQLLVNFLGSFTKQIAMVIGFIVGLAALEIDITPLLAAVGAAGFVVAFALQGTLSNFASGLLILAYRPFDVGDVIEAAGVSGTVDSVSLFSTHVRTFDNKIMIVPNNDIWGGTITNATASETRRVDLVFAIGYSDDIALAQNILKQVVDNHSLVLKDPAVNIRVNELADSSVNLICRPWTNTENYWTVYWDLMQTVKQEFDSAGITIPYPQCDVHLLQQDTSK